MQQAGAFAYGCLFQVGLSDGGAAVALTLPCATGTVFDWDLNGAVLDKHSTGGRGAIGKPCVDRPWRCGAFCAMISDGAGGITGGTLDKPKRSRGWNTHVGRGRSFRAVVARAGCGDCQCDRRYRGLRTNGFMRLRDVFFDGTVWI